MALGPNFSVPIIRLKVFIVKQHQEIQLPRNYVSPTQILQQMKKRKKVMFTKETSKLEAKSSTIVPFANFL